MNDLAVVRNLRPAPGAPALVGPFADEAIAGRWAMTNLDEGGWEVESMTLTPLPDYGLPMPRPQVVRNLIQYCPDQSKTLTDPGYAMYMEVWIRALIVVDEQLQRLGLSMAARDHLVLNAAEQQQEQDSDMETARRVMATRIFGPVIGCCSGCGRTADATRIGQVCGAALLPPSGEFCTGAFEMFIATVA